MTSTEIYDGGPSLRRDCVAFALEVHRSNNATSHGPVTNEDVIKTARVFEAYIKGEAKEGEN